MSAVILPFVLLLVNSKAFEFPFSTEIKEWKFLHKEPDITLYDMIATEPTDTYQIIYDLMGRVLGDTSLLNQFKLKLIVANETNNNQQHLPIYKPFSKSDHPFWSKPTSLYLDIIELDNDGTNIILRGSSTIALANAFNWYLEEYCNTTYDWRTYTIDMPSTLPLPSYIQKRRSVPFMYYQNVCTVSYTFAFWSWEIWQKHIDWMAMQGINMPLAFTGQEYIWSKTFAQFGFNTTDLSSFFAGPGFYAWQRMGNIQGWGGPLRESEIIGQYNLQLQILARMNSFEMTPALTCFAGHVPKAITTLYPNANVTQSPDWGHFPEQYCCVELLDVSDPLFTQIGTAFIQIQIKYFGTSHIYQCDTFNEMSPASNSTDYLRSNSEYVYNSMNAADENAIWLMQGWLFLNHFWNPTTVAAYLSGVPNDGMIILDLYSEQKPQYTRFDSFYGKPFIWNTLHDFGGHNGMQGNLPWITDRFPEALTFPNTTVMGIGTTMEGIWQNYIVYDTTYKMGYKTKPMNLTQFSTKYAYRRYGLSHTNNNNETITNNLVNGWNELVNTLYETGDKPQLNYAAYLPNFGYGAVDHDPMIVQNIWKNFINVGNVLQNVEKFRYDLVDVTRQTMSDLFNVNYQTFSKAFNSRNLSAAQKYGDILMDIINDLDNILLTDIYWMVGDWIEMARNESTDNDTKNWYEFNARNQITLWGPTGQISNYACKQWGDLIGMYYKPQWQLFVDQVIECIKNGSNWTQSTFEHEVYNKYELPWNQAIGGYHIDPVNDTITVACQLYKKWNLNGDKTC